MNTISSQIVSEKRKLSQLHLALLPYKEIKTNDFCRKLPEIKKLFCFSFLTFFKDSMLFHIYRQQMFALLHMSKFDWPVIEDVDVGCLAIIYYCFNYENSWIWKSLDTLMIQIDKSKIYTDRCYSDESFNLCIKRHLCSDVFREKVFSLFCNATALTTNFRKRIRSDLTELISNLFRSSRIFFPISFEGGQPDIIYRIFDSDGVSVDDCVIRNICFNILVCEFHSKSIAWNHKMLGDYLVRLRHLTVLSGKLSFNVGIILCTVFRAVSIFAEKDLILFRGLRFIWKDIMKLPFVTPVNSELNSEDLSCAEQKNCLLLFAAMTTFVPLASYKIYPIYRQATEIDMDDFLANQDFDLNSLYFLQFAAAEILKTSPMNKKIYLTALGGYTSVLTHWLNARRDNISIGHENTFLTISLLPAEFIMSSIKLLKHGLTHINLSAYSSCILLSCYVLRFLDKWSTNYRDCLKCCHSRVGSMYVKTVIRMQVMRKEYDVILVQFSTKILPYWKKLLRDHVNKKQHDFYGVVEHASDMLAKLLNN
jgi:hypothetical protein